MLLVFNVQNSLISFGVYGEDILLNTWQIQTDIKKTSDQYAMLLNSLLSSYNIQNHMITDAVIASVVPDIMYTLQSTIIKLFSVKPVIIKAGIKTGINVKGDNPAQIGADRIVDAVAACRLYGVPNIVISLNTVITFGFIDKKYNYYGAMILPGVNLALKALTENTAKLPDVKIIKTDKIIGKNTVENIQSGIYHGYLCMIEGLLTKIIKSNRLSVKSTHITATGEYAHLILNESRYDVNIDKDLSLKGLNIIYKLNGKYIRQI